MLNKIYIYIILLISLLLSKDKININNSEFDELINIPIDKHKILKIYDYIQSNGKIKSIYELNNISELTYNDLDILKKYISIKDETKLFKKQKYSYTSLRLISNDGFADNGMTTNLLNHYYDPFNINLIGYDELLSISNVSPMDAVAVLKQQERGQIRGSFELKNSPGISNYGYRNLLKFINYNNDFVKTYSVRVGLLANNFPSLSGSSSEEEGTSVQNLFHQNPETISKVIFSKKFINSSNNVYNNQKMLVGFLRHNNMGEKGDIYDAKSFISIEDIYISGTNIKLDRFVLGNFIGAFGSGVVFDSNDFYRPRMTGYKFGKRLVGVHPDLTRSSQYVFNGLAAQLSSKKFRLSMFYSKNSRDAIINLDGSFSTFITMRPRFGYGYNSNIYKIHENMLDAVDEMTYGTNFRYSISSSTHIGFTIYESLYSRELDPQVLESIIGGDDPEYQGDDRYLNYQSNSADPEIEAMYSSSGKSWFWNGAKSFRQVSGIEFSKVIGKMSFQAEYGELNKDSEPLKLGDGDPNAYIISSYISFDTFDFIMLYRDYDLHYDNPYQRSFSEYSRFKSTIFEDDYWLEDPIFYNLYSNNPQPQAEKGIYVESRYQFHEDLVSSIQYDVWRRKADDALYYNLVTKLEWRPVFNYRIYLRYKWKRRGADDLLHPSPFYSREARIRFQLRLSNFNNVELFYAWNYTTFSPRPRLTLSNNPLVSEMNVGDIGSPDRSLGFSFSHNIDENLNFKFGSLYCDGFLWYIEDNDFKLFETVMGLSHNWLSFNYNPNQIMSFKLKISQSTYYPYTTIVGGNTETGNFINNPYIFDEDLNYKIQLDYVL